MVSYNSGSFSFLRIHRIAYFAVFIILFVLPFNVHADIRVKKCVTLSLLSLLLIQGKLNPPTV